MCWLLPSPNELITFPRADSDKFICVASLSLIPAAYVLLCLSEPAKSTKFNFPALIL
jgi:hypothetical protein